MILGRNIQIKYFKQIQSQVDGLVMNNVKYTSEYFKFRLLANQVNNRIPIHNGNI